MCRKHKVKNLLKLSQVQMRMFPHQALDADPESVFANIVDEDTAICSVCEKQIDFKADEADLIPDDFSKKNTEYAYASSDGMRYARNKFTIVIDPVQKEEWVPQDQDLYKEQLFEKLEWLANSFKTIGSLFYEKVLSENIEIEPFKDHKYVLSFPSGKTFNLFGSKITFEPTDWIESISSTDKIISWLLKDDDGNLVDIAADLPSLGGIWAYTTITYVVNDALRADHVNKILDLLKSQNIDDILRIYHEILPVIAEKQGDGLSIFSSRLSQFVSNPELFRHSLFGLRSEFLDAYDNVNVLISKLKSEDKNISTSLDVKRDSGRKIIPIYQLPICLNCVDEIIGECSDCGDYKYIVDLNNYDGILICDGCSESWGSCDACGRSARTEDLHYSEDDGEVYCDGCYEEHQEVDPSDFENPDDLASQEPIFLSGNKQTLERLASALESFKNKTKGGPASKLKQDLINVFKANGIKEDETKIIMGTLDESGSAALIGDPVGEQDFKWYIQKYISAIKNFISHQESFYSKYPLAIDQDTKTENIYSGKKIELLKNYQPMPVKYEYDSAHRGTSSFVIKMIPAPALITQSETLFPGVGRTAWKYISNSGTQHHPGCIAYARMSYDGDNLVINNLQRDADLNNINLESYKSRYRDPEEAAMAEKALRWWDKRTSRWYVQFTDYLINFSKNNEKKLYITNFDTQKAKWGRIPEKNVEVYDNLPQELSSAAFYKKLQEMKAEDPSETVESLREKVQNGVVSILPTYDAEPDSNLILEDSKRPVNGIWRLAKKNNILKIFKRAKINKAL